MAMLGRDGACWIKSPRALGQQVSHIFSYGSTIPKLLLLLDRRWFLCSSADAASAIARPFVRSERRRRWLDATLEKRGERGGKACLHRWLRGVGPRGLGLESSKKPRRSSRHKSRARAGPTAGSSVGAPPCVVHRADDAAGSLSTSASPLTRNVCRIEATVPLR
ncbi:hypothetical protein MRX96_014620 [Rhipicephalus microplus]